MNKIKFVALNRAEGRIQDCFAVLFSNNPNPQPINDKHFQNPKIIVSQDIKSDVLKTLVEWGRTAPKDNGYDKVDFIVKWDNGKSYIGRFDMQEGGTDSKEDFFTSLQNRIKFYACQRRPSHFKQEHWEHHCKQSEKNGWKQECEEILTNCEL